MPFEHSPAATGWSARLALGFAARGGESVLVRREHAGPLRVQKALHPEGPGVCHAILVHPPSGMVGGDSLTVDLALGAGAHALITTPGAGKWYRSLGGTARQSMAAQVGDRAVLEWLPQESIVYDGARADIDVSVALVGQGTYLGMEVLCFGRTASGERYRAGACRLRTRIERDGAPVWIERGQVVGGDALLDSPVGLQGQPVVASLLAASPHAGPPLLDACRAVDAGVGRGAVTLLPGVLVARWLGPACEPARQWLDRLWSVVRPAVAGRAAVRPRIWNT
jgi:urease accessory protein